MKALTKKKYAEKNTVEAYSFGCACTCVCHCIEIGSLNLESSGYGNPFADISVLPKVG